MNDHYNTYYYYHSPSLVYHGCLCGWNAILLAFDGIIVSETISFNNVSESYIDDKYHHHHHDDNGIPGHSTACHP